MVLQSLVHPARTLEQLNKQRETKVFTDVTILVSGERFAAHRALLAAHSPVFKQVLEDSSLTQENVPNINLDGVEALYFSILLDFIYTSKLAIDMSNVDQVSATSLFLQVQSVAELCSKFKETNAKSAAESTEEICKEVTIETNETAAEFATNTKQEQIEVEVTEEFPSLQSQVDSAIALLNKPLDSGDFVPNHNKLSSGRKRGRKAATRLSCPVCGKMMTQARLDVHLRSHTGEKTVACSICKKAFANIYNLKIHERKHSGEKPYRCPICPRAYADPSSLCKHKLWHAGVKRNKCSVCGRLFSTQTQVKEHMRTHTKERPFFCPECGKTYAYKCDLTRHMREHSGDLLGPCQYCGRRFTHLGNYKTHVRNHEKAGTEKVRLGSQTFLVSNARASNAVTIMSQSSDVNSNNQERAVVKVADFTDLMADAQEIEVVINDGNLVVKERSREDIVVLSREMSNGDVSLRREIANDAIGMDNNVVSAETDGQLVIVDQIIDSKFNRS